MKTLDELIEAEIAMAVERIARLSQRAALAAFERHFSTATPGAGIGGAPEPPPPPRRKNRKPALPRRSKEEIAALSNRFLELVRSEPGQSMSVLAPRIGVTASELQVPVARLKVAKKVKTVALCVNDNETRALPIIREQQGEFVDCEDVGRLRKTTEFGGRRDA